MRFRAPGSNPREIAKPRLFATDRDRMLSELQRDGLVRQDENDKWVGCAKGTGPE